MKQSLWLGLLILALGLTGCIESTTLVSLNPDGSGEIYVREYYSPQVTQMLEGMSSMGRMMGPEGAEAPESGDLFKQILDDRLEQYGDGVTLKSKSDETNDAGWKGFRAVFAFADINELKLAMQNEGPGTPGATPGADEEAQAFDFSFTPGSPAVLKMKMGEMPDEEAEAAPEAPSMEGMEDMSAQMMQAMAPMMKGMRVRMLLRVNGTVSESNASFPAEGKPNLFTLMDVSMDAVLDDPEAMQKLMSAGEDLKSPDALARLDLPGVKVEKPGRDIMIRFR